MEKAPGNERKRYAHSVVQYAIRQGRMRRQPCVVGKECKGSIEAHHPDYADPMRVEWLCRRHHKALHNGTLKW